MSRSARSGRVTALVGALLLTVAGMLPVALTGSLAVRIRSDLGISEAWIGVLLSLFYTAGAVLAVRVGRGADNLGWRRASMLTGVASVVVLVGIAAVGTTPWVFGALLAVGGIVMTTTMAVGNLILAHEMPDGRLGFMLGIKQTAVPLAGIGAGLAVPVVALQIGWRWAFLAAAAVPVLALVAAGRHTGGAPARLGAGEEAARLRPTRRLVILATGMGLASVIPGSLTGFTVITAVDAGLAEASAGLLLAVGSMVGLLVRVGGGWIVDRITSDGFREVVVLLTAGSAGTLLIATGRPTLIVVGTLIAFGTGWGWPALFFYGLLTSYPEAPGEATGITQTGALVGAALGPLVVGVALERFGPGPAWGFVAVVTLGAAAMIAHALQVERVPV